MIHHDEKARRFQVETDGILSVLEYSLNNRVMTIEHTRVPPAVGGRGIASDLTRAAFAFAREQGLKIIPACSYAATWAKRHPEVAGLLKA